MIQNIRRDAILVCLAVIHASETPSKDSQVFNRRFGAEKLSINKALVTELPFIEKFSSWQQG